MKIFFDQKLISFIIYENEDNSQEIFKIEDNEIV